MKLKGNRIGRGRGELPDGWVVFLFPKTDGCAALEDAAEAFVFFAGFSITAVSDGD